MAKIDEVKEHIKEDRLFWFLSMIIFMIFAEELVFKQVQFIAFSIICVASIISAIYFYQKLQKNIKLLDKL